MIDTMITVTCLALWFLLGASTAIFELRKMLMKGETIEAADLVIGLFGCAFPFQFMAVGYLLAWIAGQINKISEQGRKVSAHHGKFLALENGKRFRDSRYCTPMLALLYQVRPSGRLSRQW